MGFCQKYMRLHRAEWLMDSIRHDPKNTIWYKKAGSRTSRIYEVLEASAAVFARLVLELKKFRF